MGDLRIWQEDAKSAERYRVMNLSFTRIYSAKARVYHIYVLIYILSFSLRRILNINITPIKNPLILLDLINELRLNSN